MRHDFDIILFIYLDSSHIRFSCQLRQATITVQVNLTI